jgi:hypothetical protein
LFLDGENKGGFYDYGIELCSLLIIELLKRGFFNYD